MPEKHTIRLEPLGKTLKTFPGTPLMDILHEYGIDFPCGGKGTCHNCKVRIIDGGLDTDSDAKRILQEKGLDPAWRLSCKSRVNQDVTLEISRLETVILADSTPFSFKPAIGYGLAVDLGTTTIVIQLVNLSDGHVLDADTAINVQSRYGADIMSRITYALNPSGLEKLCRLIRDQLWELIQGIIKRHNIVPCKIVIVGNTVMHHLFSKIDVSSLAYFPFETSEGGKKLFKASDLCWALPDETDIIFMPSLGSFVGSDTLAGILATGIDKSKDLIALIDLGTNGEIVVGNRDLILAASTAAGPAFEGTHISQGMRATTGAISSVFLKDKKLEYHVIGNDLPRGICGSGIIDAVSVFLKTGQISVTGQITSDETDVLVTGSVKLTQKDIYEYMLAKAAIASGMYILLNIHGKLYADIKRVYIAGGFGYFITISNAIASGLLEFPEEQIVKAGNTALIGAKMLLFCEDKYEADILKKTRHISLESNAEFQDIFMQKMMLKRSDSSEDV